MFLHELGVTEDTWVFAARGHYDDPAMCYGSRLYEHRVARVRERTVAERSAQCHRGELADTA